MYFWTTFGALSLPLMCLTCDAQVTFWRSCVYCNLQSRPNLERLLTLINGTLWLQLTFRWLCVCFSLQRDKEFTSATSVSVHTPIITNFDLLMRNELFIQTAIDSRVFLYLYTDHCYIIIFHTTKWQKPVSCYMLICKARDCIEML